MLHVFDPNISLSKSAAKNLSVVIQWHYITKASPCWNDDNAMCFLDNNVESGEDNWQLIEAQDKGEQIIIHIPKVAAIYRKTYGWVDRTNQELAYHDTEHRTVRKQSRVLDSMAEMYDLNNMYIIFK